jgi:uncharacterized protein
MQTSRVSGANRRILPRVAATRLEEALAVMPVVVVMGARQTGKSTLATALPALTGYPYVTLDDLATLAQARAGPEDLVRRAPRMIIDEVQREDSLIIATKRVVDEQPQRTPGQFVLTGSANLLLMERVRETLAGRASYVPVWPMTRREQLGQGATGIWSQLWSTPVEDWYDLVRDQGAPPEDWRELARRGGYPTPATELANQSQRHVWFGGYLETYLTRDLQHLSAIENIIDFARLMRIAALRLGNLMNKSEMARDAGLTQPTAHRYLNLLETSYQLISLEAYAVNRTKRLVKSPKAYWSDTGLALFLAEEDEPRGAHLENLVLCDLIAWRDAQVRQPKLMYWRTRIGEEVDFVIERGEELLPVEVKAGARPHPADTRGVRAFRDEYGDRVRGGLLLHTGDETFWITRHVLAAPWWRIV